MPFTRSKRAETCACNSPFGIPYVSSTFVGVSNVEEAKTNIEAIGEQPDEQLLREIDEIVSPYKV